MEVPPFIAESLRAGTCLRLVLSKRAKAAGETADKITVRPIVNRGQSEFQFTRHKSGRETHENLDVSQAVARVASLFGPAFAHCHLFAIDADYAARVGRDGRVSVRKQPSTLKPTAESHDRRKTHLLPDGVPCPFLIEVGIMTSEGHVKSAKYAKFRQINRFLELVDDTLSALPGQGPLHVVDFGCGKSYLTFALHHLLTGVHGRVVRIVGLDRNAEVIRDCSRVAARLGCEGLSFEVGDIAAYESREHVHMAVSLHACDTATDFALAQAVRWQAEVILAVPCCQHEVANLIRDGELAPILDHGILKDRLAAILTDAMRAKCLEICGYRTQVVEFIDMEHTAKNILIRATRGRSDAAARSRRLAELQQLQRRLGLERFALQTSLGIDGGGARETPVEP